MEAFNACVVGLEEVIASCCIEIKNAIAIGNVISSECFLYALLIFFAARLVWI